VSLLTQLLQVAEFFEEEGRPVLVAKVPRLASLEQRAQCLAEQTQLFLAALSEQRGRPVRLHLLGHSMGGLDARQACRLLPPNCVASVITISTPHAGTLLAPNLSMLPKALAGIADLSPEAAEKFNAGDKKENLFWFWR
jgi:triacylglycerol esterase/lipase EstA (alpha/beta hydrolase family)